MYRIVLTLLFVFLCVSTAMASESGDEKQRKKLHGCFEEDIPMIVKENYGVLVSLAQWTEAVKYTYQKQTAFDWFAFYRAGIRCDPVL